MRPTRTSTGATAARKRPCTIIIAQGRIGGCDLLYPSPQGRVASRDARRRVGHGNKTPTPARFTRRPSPQAGRDKQDLSKRLNARLRAAQNERVDVVRALV